MSCVAINTPGDSDCCGAVVHRRWLQVGRNSRACLGPASNSRTITAADMPFDMTADSTLDNLVQNGFWSQDKTCSLKADSSTMAVAEPASPESSPETAAVAAARVGPQEQSDENVSPRSHTSETAPLELADDMDFSSAFNQLCNEGWAWSRKNLLVKIYRFTLLIIKQVYLLFMTLSMPTNHLMVGLTHWADVCRFSILHYSAAGCICLQSCPSLAAAQYFSCHCYNLTDNNNMHYSYGLSIP